MNPMTELPLDAAGRRPAFFSQDGVDQLASMVLELATELWTLKERLYVLESAAEQHGLPLRATIEGWTPTAADESELASQRAALLGNLFRTLGRDHRSVETTPLATDLTA